MLGWRLRLVLTLFQNKIRVGAKSPGRNGGDGGVVEEARGLRGDSAWCFGLDY